jgi:GR25 family glycosyltransferase involved in LPS biosynthesis
MYKVCLPEIVYPTANATKRAAYIYQHAMSSLSLGELALICSHRKVMERIVNDTSIGESDFSLILEDDAKLHYKVRDAICKWLLG